jgi:hypothetical protein
MVCHNPCWIGIILYYFCDTTYIHDIWGFSSHSSLLNTDRVWVFEDIFVRFKHWYQPLDAQEAYKSKCSIVYITKYCFPQNKISHSIFMKSIKEVPLGACTSNAHGLLQNFLSSTPLALCRSHEANLYSRTTLKRPVNVGHIFLKAHITLNNLMSAKIISVGHTNSLVNVWLNHAT